MNPTPNSNSISSRFSRNATGPSIKALLGIVLAAFLMLGFTSRSEASFRTTIDGVTVSYSGSGQAYYNPDDETLTIEIYSHNGSLNVTVGYNAPLFWGNGVDILILAHDATLRSINIRGRPDCIAYVAGQVNYVTKFLLSNGVVGNTVFYGSDYGLGMTSDLIPPVISMRYSYATAQLFGYPNETFARKSATTEPAPRPEGARVRSPRDAKPAK